MHRKDNVNHNHLCLHQLVGDRSPNGCRPIVDFVTTSRRLVSNFNDDSKFSRRPIGEWLAIGLRLVCNWSATDCRSKIWSVIGCRWLSMVVGCHWSATGCRYSVTVALMVPIFVLLCTALNSYYKLTLFTPCSFLIIQLTASLHQWQKSRHIIK